MFLLVLHRDLSRWIKFGRGCSTSEKELYFYVRVMHCGNVNTVAGKMLGWGVGGLGCGSKLPSSV